MNGKAQTLEWKTAFPCLAINVDFGLIQDVVYPTNNVHHIPASSSPPHVVCPGVLAGASNKDAEVNISTADGYGNFPRNIIYSRRWKAT